ncbi:hypothetical protein KL86APRO_12556 [uncultured Alphaproteobacteria bacterium]|uniref:Uncharacterized protein n=1 Tax=uncultured Alphaproteobacteria bacterium TaxID=91750 RepID=A0A212KC56_9PROT|nr:hypothetical protein KL86APRO_12556 [uncultured Alphaproteobacteria bacterium]
MDEIELRTELAMLQGQVDGLKWLVNGLVLALNRKEIIGLREAAEVLTVVETYVRHTETEAATIPLRSSIGFLEAMLETPELDPLKALLISALLHADAGKAMKRPLQTWLSEATEDEIAQELDQLVSRLQSRSDHQTPPSGSST